MFKFFKLQRTVTCARQITFCQIQTTLKTSKKLSPLIEFFVMSIIQTREYCSGSLPRFLAAAGIALKTDLDHPCFRLASGGDHAGRSEQRAARLTVDPD